jgi:hypothetical protein
MALDEISFRGAVRNHYGELAQTSKGLGSCCGPAPSQVDATPEMIWRAHIRRIFECVAEALPEDEYFEKPFKVEDISPRGARGAGPMINGTLQK